MNTTAFKSILSVLLAEGKGVLAMDESTPTCNKRFAQYGIAQNEETRRSYRDLILTTPGLNEFISGVILCDETIRQFATNGQTFISLINGLGIIPGIKVDMGAKDIVGHPGEKITEGLDGLQGRLYDYAQLGARFAKWRAVITIGEGIPTRGCIQVNAHTLARYASLCQQVGLIPIVEPEVLMDGEHSLDRCFEVTQEVLHTVFNQLYEQKVAFEYMILKANMVLPGINCLQQESVNEVAEATISCFLRTVPAAVPGIAFLSGGQPGDLAAARLSAMNMKYKFKMPWVLTFSFSRAIQQPALALWKGYPENILEAQKALYHRSRCCSAARLGEYSASLEHDYTFPLIFQS
ncbi:MAG: class I fructose-bisphosphate aldolase [Bacteroidota bacterium]|nr:class I fructose-bisphosphate aldolase [Bacteroidota bacterium]